jgi:hypothetical protein
MAHVAKQISVDVLVYGMVGGNTVVKGGSLLECCPGCSSKSSLSHLELSTAIQEITTQPFRLFCTRIIRDEKFCLKNNQKLTTVQVAKSFPSGRP